MPKITETEDGFRIRWSDAELARSERRGRAERLEGLAAAVRAGNVEPALAHVARRALGLAGLSDPAKLEDATRAFLSRVVASATLAPLLAEAEGSPEHAGPAATLLEGLASAEGLRVKEELRGAPPGLLADLDPQELDRRAAVLAEAADLLEGGVSIGGGESRVGQDRELAERVRDRGRELAPLQLGSVLDLDRRRRPEGRRLTPERVLARFVDAALGGHAEAERNRFAAALAREVLGLEATPERIGALMRQERRERREARREREVAAASQAELEDFVARLGDHFHRRAFRAAHVVEELRPDWSQPFAEELLRRAAGERLGGRLRLLESPPRTFRVSAVAAR